MIDVYEIVKSCLTSSFLRMFRNDIVSLVLYGSYARREARPDSDVNVIVVLERVSEDRFELHKLLDNVENNFWNCLAEFGIYRRPVISPVVLDRESARVFQPL
ncbi:MAG: nucleotidyltransferase domain-containing protein [Crenarchaeota archaeon]|nr:nucleotidyltransferase domain-containing protein [Thermoproteota archaeon]